MILTLDHINKLVDVGPARAGMIQRRAQEPLEPPELAPHERG